MTLSKSAQCICAILLIFVLLNIVGCTQKKTPLPEHPGGKIYQGDMRYDVKCHGCHGWLGEGGTDAPALVTSGKTIAPDKFVGAVIYGRGGMPAYGNVLREDDILLVIDWLEKISYQSR